MCSRTTSKGPFWAVCGGQNTKRRCTEGANRNCSLLRCPGRSSGTSSAIFWTLCLNLLFWINIPLQSSKMNLDARNLLSPLRKFLLRNPAHREVPQTLRDNQITPAASCYCKELNSPCAGFLPGHPEFPEQEGIPQFPEQEATDPFLVSLTTNTKHWKESEKETWSLIKVWSGNYGHGHQWFLSSLSHPWLLVLATSSFLLALQNFIFSLLAVICAAASLDLTADRSNSHWSFFKESRSLNFIAENWNTS